MKSHATSEVAKIVGVGKTTLLTWLREGRIPEPKRISQGGVVVRLWSDRNIEQVRKYKEEHFRKGRGRKKAL